MQNDEIKSAFESWQNSGIVHPFTCINGCGSMVYVEGGMVICEKCGWRQILNGNMIRLVRLAMTAVNLVTALERSDGE